MGSRASLERARKRKNNEFYTPRTLVEVGLALALADNPGLFRGRTVLLPCDDPDWSEFTKYFIDNFERLGLVRLISTCFDRHGGRGRYLEAFEDGSMVTGQLDGDGDFRSAEVTSLRDEADIVITNPPFEHAREFLTWLLAGHVDFLFIGPNTLPSTKVFRDAYFAGLVRPVQGTCGAKRFYNQYGNAVNAAITWFTNMRTAPVPVTPVDPEEGLAAAGKRGAWKQYQPYDNVAACEVGTVATIPRGYCRPLGVPITYSAQEHSGYCVLDCANRFSDTPTRGIQAESTLVKGRAVFLRYLIISTDGTADVKELSTCPA